MNNTRRNAMLLAVAGTVALSVVGFGQQEALDAYTQAVSRWTVDYLVGTAEMTVQIGDNEPASYTLKMWLRGMDTAISVITAADADFMRGVALLQQDRQVTAWWPTLQRSKTFASQRTDEEIGLSVGWLERLAQHPSDYELSALEHIVDQWRIEVRPQTADALFDHAVISVNKANHTIAAARFYDGEGVLLQTDRVTEYADVHREAGGTVLFPVQMEIIDIKQDKTTTVTYTELRIPERIDDAFFTMESLNELADQALTGQL